MQFKYFTRKVAFAVLLFLNGASALPKKAAESSIPEASVASSAIASVPSATPSTVSVESAVASISSVTTSVPTATSVSSVATSIWALTPAIASSSSSIAATAPATSSSTTTSPATAVSNLPVANAPLASAPVAQTPAAPASSAQAVNAPAVNAPVAQTPAAQTPAPGTPAIDTPAVVTPLAPATVTTYIPPLSKSEINEQHKSFVHAKYHPEFAASQVIQALKTQGKAVPSAVVPFQSQQTEVKHSGVKNIVEFIENTDRHANPDVEAHPEGGKYYLKYFNGTDPKVADEYAKENNAYLPLTVFNPSKMDMCIFGGATDLIEGKVTPFALEGSESGLTPLAANSTVQFGNYIHEHNVNGRIQALFGCDKDCKKCAGEKEGPIHTLFEFMHADHAPGQTVHSWFNPSDVDGYTTDFNVTVFNDEGICKRRACHSTVKDMKKHCPENNLWHDKGVYGCKSECKVTGRDDHCCVGAFGLPKTCPASSGFLHELCPDAYSWPYDDVDHTDTCTGTKKIHLVFAPIGQMAMIKYPKDYPIWMTS
ncbi:Osmotin, thaumatin-like protein [Acephala macrosclerotiorum]|nr:Osmotin, thaumatin-like protein [Acephala macrosclerotiorum]